MLVLVAAIILIAVIYFFAGGEKETAAAPVKAASVKTEAPVNVTDQFKPRAPYVPNHGSKHR